MNYDLPECFFFFFPIKFNYKEVLQMDFYFFN